MKKLIDAEELMELLRKERCCCPEEFYEIGYNAGIDDAVKAVDNVPAADAWPALRAEWNFVTEDEWGKGIRMQQLQKCRDLRNI